MTRHESANVLDNIFVGAPDDRANAALAFAAAELRKTCATCQHFSDTSGWAPSRQWACATLNAWVPANGSGHCYRWDGK